MSCGVSRTTFFLCFVDRATAAGGVAAVIKVVAVIKNGGVIWIYKKAHNVYYV